ncbi:MAG: hypothetical protein ABSH42_17855 [Bryobacteraceae bacterium]|jgi:hypothetical protein
MDMIPCRAAVCWIAFAQILGAQPTCPSRDELRHVIASGDLFGDANTVDSIFYHERRLRPVIRSFLRDDQTREGAERLLALIGDPGDLRLVIRLAPPPKPGPHANGWAYHVATALLKPSNEQEWAFLRQCALDGFDDHRADAGAIQTLKLIASPRSLKILNETLQQNTRESSAAAAIAYIQANPPPLTDENLNRLADRVANAIRVGKQVEPWRIRYNAGGDKALVDWAYNTGQTYTATFHKVGGLWRVLGVRVTLQRLAFEFVGSPRYHWVDPQPPELTWEPTAWPSALDEISPPIQPPSPPQDASPNPKKN